MAVTDWISSEDQCAPGTACMTIGDGRRPLRLRQAGGSGRLSDRLGPVHARLARDAADQWYLPGSQNGTGKELATWAFPPGLVTDVKSSDLGYELRRQPSLEEVNASCEHLAWDRDTLTAGIEVPIA